MGRKESLISFSKANIINYYIQNKLANVKMTELEKGEEIVEAPAIKYAIREDGQISVASAKKMSGIIAEQARLYAATVRDGIRTPIEVEEEGPSEIAEESIEIKIEDVFTEPMIEEPVVMEEFTPEPVNESVFEEVVVEEPVQIEESVIEEPVVPTIEEVQIVEEAPVVETMPTVEETITIKENQEIQIPTIEPMAFNPIIDENAEVELIHTETFFDDEENSNTNTSNSLNLGIPELKEIPLTYDFQNTLQENSPIIGTEIEFKPFEENTTFNPNMQEFDIPQVQEPIEFEQTMISEGFEVPQPQVFEQPVFAAEQSEESESPFVMPAVDTTEQVEETVEAPVENPFGEGNVTEMEYVEPLHPVDGDEEGGDIMNIAQFLATL